MRSVGGTRYAWHAGDLLTSIETRASRVTFNPIGLEQGWKGYRWLSRCGGWPTVEWVELGHSHDSEGARGSVLIQTRIMPTIRSIRRPVPRLLLEEYAEAALWRDLRLWLRLNAHREDSQLNPVVGVDELDLPVDGKERVSQVQITVDVPMIFPALVQEKAWIAGGRVGGRFLGIKARGVSETLPACEWLTSIEKYARGSRELLNLRRAGAQRSSEMR